MARGQGRGEPPPINYPEGDHPFGVVFYRIDSRRLNPRDCMAVIRAMAEEFILQGPFRVRLGFRKPEEGKHEYWVGFNAEACGRAFERDVDIRAHRITRALRLPGASQPPRLNRLVLSDEEIRALTNPVEETEWGSASPGDPPSIEYSDHYWGVAFYRLVRSEVDPTLALEAVKDIAGLLLQPVGRSRPIVVRCRFMEEPPQYYWVVLNNAVAAGLFEGVLSEARARVKKKTSPPDGFGNPTLRTVLDIQGVPRQPPGSVPPPTPAPLPRADPRSPDPDPLEPPQATRDRLAWARRIDLSGMGARLRGVGRRRQRGAPSESPPE